MKTSMLSETNPFLMDIAAAEAAAVAAKTMIADSTAIDINQDDVFVDEEASEAETVPNIVSGSGRIDGDGDAVELEKMLPPTQLPPPQEFGGGNPFLMFLCLSLLLQHRNFVMNNHMDYNEMAMHFDKMVRKHNVVRVLNQARCMYADYLKTQQQQQKYRTTTMMATATTTNATPHPATAAASSKRPSVNT